MKRVIDALMTFLVFFGAWKLFPEYVCCKDLKTLIISVIVLYIISFIGAFIIFAGTLLASIKVRSTACTIIYLLLLIVYSFLTLLITTMLVPGFSINGVVTYILLIFATSLLTPSSKSE